MGVEHAVGVEHVQPLRTGKDKTPRYQYVVPGSLGSIIRQFKAAVTREWRRTPARANEEIWQRNYYEHIIRSDISHFFIAQYIEINPLMWTYDRDNLRTERQLLIEELSTILETQYNITGERLEAIIEQESDYRNWIETSEQN
jgi:hypothetical protein